MGSFSILNNISSVNGQLKLNVNNLNLSRTLQRLSSGKRINTGADDAAGLQIADSLRGNVQALNQAMRNAGDGIGFCQIADGALSGITDMLHRMVTLAEEAVSDIISAEGHKALDVEFQEIQAEIGRVVKQTNYNGFNILDCNKKEYGDTLDVFVGDLSAVSYIPINIGCITIIPPITDKLMDEVQSAVIANEKTITPDGHFHFSTQNNNGVEANSSEQLQWAGSDQWSQPAIRIKVETSPGSGVYEYLEYAIWRVSDPFPPSTYRPVLEVATETVYDDDKTWITVFKTDDPALAAKNISLQVIQTVTVVANPDSIGGESYKIEYTVKNTGSVAVDFDFMYHIEINGSFGSFLVDGKPINPQTYTGGNIPDLVEVQTDNLLSNPIITLTGTGGDAPSKVRFGGGRATSTFNDGDSLTASGYKGYSVIWENKTIAAGATSSSFSTYYGVQTLINPAANEGPLKVVSFNMNSAAGLVEIDLLTPDNALRALTHIRAALNEVSIMRGNIGAGMNRLQAAINVLAATSMNTLAAESNIRDANMAEEITNLAKFQILAQTGIAALAQANSNSTSVLSLLSMK